MKKLLFLPFVFIVIQLSAQSLLAPLTIEKIMRDTKWIGTSPSQPYWSLDGKQLFFNWNPDKALTDSVYFITTTNHTPQKTDYAMRKNMLSADDYVYNTARTGVAFVKNDDIFWSVIKTGVEQRITKTVEKETNPVFIKNDQAIAYRSGQNLYMWDLATGQTTQLTNFVKGNDPEKEGKKDSLNAQEKWLMKDQLANFEVLHERKWKKDSSEAAEKALTMTEVLKPVYYADKNVVQLMVSPTARFITFGLSKRATKAKYTIIPNYVTEAGFTEDINGRTKVGAPQGTSEFYIFDTEKDTVILVRFDSVEGIREVPVFKNDYPGYDSIVKKKLMRDVMVANALWNMAGTRLIAEIYAEDNKDRWIVMVDAATGKLTLLNRQHDGAWIGGPGIGSFRGSKNKWINNDTYWFQSEATGYSHLYTVNVITSEVKQLTTGNFEVQDAQLSADRSQFYITTNQLHPGEKHFYKLPVAGGMSEQVTSATGANLITISPDEKNLAILYSYSNKPWELYVQPNKKGAQAKQITFKAQSDTFSSYPWRNPEVITFTAQDGAQVYARIYKPVKTKAGAPAVIFVHGAGYLQNAHKWWSSYFREYMFHNLLADRGYTVLDIDYRGSAGYGRDWRTGIYRFMGGKDLDDQVDAAKFLVDSMGVNAKNIGIYGGSYGGFITLMAMFTKPGVFAAGAGLRSVTDWAHYNHGYTSNILNLPYNDSIAYQKSSPIYHAQGLKGKLLMCHGMVDVNVHFQDIVRLSQRLIELKKDNWELAVYPMEDHGFVEPSSWTDEYKRIFKLFEENLHAE